MVCELIVFGGSGIVRYRDNLRSDLFGAPGGNCGQSGIKHCPNRCQARYEGHAGQPVYIGSCICRIAFPQLRERGVGVVVQLLVGYRPPVVFVYAVNVPSQEQIGFGIGTINLIYNLVGKINILKVGQRTARLEILQIDFFYRVRSLRPFAVSALNIRFYPADSGYIGYKPHYGRRKALVCSYRRQYDCRGEH